ncbi:cytochrome P450 [Sinomonas sp. B1-1]|uniref:cytochrome P450 n=1 Tax=Sinomonas sp. B1-1 TaxID=3141454 RepID=UPI003D29375E
MAPSAIPRLPDSTLAFRREGYTFISTRCDRLGTDVFGTRLLLRPVVCLRGAEASATFYDPLNFTRENAVPRSAQHLLQDQGSVQTLTGLAHHRRKRLFLDQLTDRSEERLAERFAAAFDAALSRPDCRRFVLDTEVRAVLTEAALRWAGLEAPPAVVQQRSEEFGLMVDKAGSLGPPNWKARRRRVTTERWAAEQIARLREDGAGADSASPAAAVALHRDDRGQLLPEPVAAVELLNLLRPVVAVGRFMAFAVVALIQRPLWRARLAEGSAEDELLFSQEVRRYFPFFPLVGGTALRRFAWRGHEFEAGDMALLDLYGTNHDSRVWHDPESFDPDRFHRWNPDPNTLIPQGGGDVVTGHRCPGEGATLGLISSAARVVGEHPEFEARIQDLTIDLRHMPAAPRSGVVLTRRQPPTSTKGQ